METNISSKPESIQIVYDWYKSNKLIVNRKYQRKLVWTIEEKQAFIDSIYQQFSVPLFLLAATKHQGKDAFEIIDGMQRLDAIFSFIENEFPININGKAAYFNLETLANTIVAKDEGVLSQKTPILPREDCVSIVTYQLPFSFAYFQEEAKIEEIFRRINSYGRQLSEQEIRQAGALGKFPNLVRVIASQIRRDSSPSDILSLSQMKEISLSNRRLKYGVDITSIFWVKQNIITPKNMRISRDEELVAYILTYILMSPDFNPSRKYLDQLYQYEIDSPDNLYTKAEQEIEKQGFDKIISWFNQVYDQIEYTLKKAPRDFRTILYNDNKASGLFRSFQVIFLAIYELMIIERMKISNHNGLLKVLNGLGNKHLNGIGGEEWNGEYRKQKVQALKGIFKPFFEAVSGSDVAVDNWVSKFENLLSNSKVENSQYDFKISFFDLKDGKTFCKELVGKIVKTLTAMANKGPNEKGYVIVGVADSEQDAKQYKNLYGTDYIVFQGFNISGLNGEISRNFGKRDDFLNRIKTIIKAEPIEGGVQDYILSNLRLINYYDKDILVFEIASRQDPISYGDKYYHRVLSSSEKISSAVSIKALFDKFK